MLDGEDLGAEFRAFIHSPFKAEEDDERNDTSLGMQISLGNEDDALKVLIFGDLKHDSLRKIIDISKANENEEKLEWNILLAPHHCSKSVMYTKDENDENVFQREMMDDLASYCLDIGYVVSSSKSIPASNKKGDNPPHAIAKERYEEIVSTDFLCTHSGESEDAEPIVFENTDNALVLNGEAVSVNAAKSLSDSVNDARASGTPQQIPQDLEGCKLRSNGQDKAVNQLNRIEAASNNAFRVVRINEPHEENSTMYALIEINCLGIKSSDDGLKLRPKEKFTVCIPENFPFKYPSVYVSHARFNGFAHVQWVRHLCLFLSLRH